MSKRKATKTTQSAHNQSNTKSSKPFLERFQWLGVLLVVGCTYLVFAGVVKNDFIDYQDSLLILNNGLIQNISLQIFGEPISNHYQPLTLLSFAFNYHAAHLTPAAYHCTNLILHLINVILVFYMLYLLGHRKPLVGLIGALVFAIHPMQTEAVAWLSARSILVYGFFILLSLIAYLQYCNTQKPWWRVAAIFTYVLALFSNSAAILFPFVLLNIHYFRGDSIDRKLSMKWAEFWVISLGFLAMALYYHQVGNAEGNMLNILMDSTYAFTSYLVKFIVPFKLAIFHPSPSVVRTQMVLYYLSPIVVLLFIGLTIWAYRSARFLAFGLLFFAANIVWFLPFLQHTESVVNESNGYIAYIGLAYIAANRMQHFWQRNEKSPQQIGKIVLGGGIIAALFFAYISHERVAVWESNFTVWEDAIQKYPQTSYMGYAFKGDYYRSIQNYTEALNQYNQAVDINPNYGAVYHRRAITHHFLKNTKAAEADYLRAIEMNEGKYMSYANLCKIHRMEGDYEQAMKECNAAIEGDDFEEKHNVYLQRATMLALAKNYEKALDDYNEYLKHETEDGKAYRWRAIAYYELKNYDEAMKDIQSALNLNASDATAYLYRYRIHKLRNNPEAARLDSIRAKDLGAPF